MSISKPQVPDISVQTASIAHLYLGVLTVKVALRGLPGTDESAVLLLYVDIIGIKFGRSSRVLHHRVSAKFKQPPLHHFTTTLLLLFLFLSVVCFMILIRLFTAAMEHVHL